tara:strand:+ start:450 stop:995 length:546 start_codon:yes stop_codon:yes gene_type:complete
MIIRGISKGQETQIKATTHGELLVRAITETEIEHASSTGRAFIFQSSNSDIGAGDTRLFIKNTSDDFLILDRLIINPGNVVCRYDIGMGSDITTPTGTAITAVNMNQQFSGTTFGYVAFDDETAVADTTTLLSVTCSTTESLQVPIDGIILGKNHYIQINQETESTSGQVCVIAHFEEDLI